jgi:hypothetical protein
MRKPPTGEPCAGEPHARFGGRGGYYPSRPLSSAETVEKPQTLDFNGYKYLKSLWVKLLKLGFLDFFDSFAIYQRLT